MLTTPAQRAASKRWRERHPERQAATQAKQVARMALPENVERRRKYNRDAYARDPQRQIAANARWRKDPKNMMADRLRTKLRRAMIAGLTSSIEQLLACSLEEFRAHIASQFEAGMTWVNYGRVWELDHIEPCATFNLLRPEEQAVCFHYRNLRPLFKRQNKIKHRSLMPVPDRSLVTEQGQQTP